MSGQVYKEPFAQIPEWLLDADVSDRAIRVFCVLQRHADRDGRAFPGRKRLSKRCRCSTASIDRALNELRATGAVISENVFEGDAIVGNNYWLWPATPSSPVSRGSVTDEARGSVTGESGVAPPVTHKREPSNESQIEREPEEGGDASLVATDSTKAEARRLCELLACLVFEQRGGSDKPKVSERWVKDMDLLLRRGPLGIESATAMSAEKVEASIRFVFENLATPSRDGFCWADQIRSPGALREKWAKLRDAARRLEGGRVGRGTAAVERAERIAARDRGETYTPTAFSDDLAVVTGKTNQLNKGEEPVEVTSHGT